MATFYVHECDKCSYSVETSGLHEFYRDDEGSRKPYGHPIPMSQEAAKRGVCGLSAALYCPKCDKVHDLVVVEFKEPPKDSLSMWLGQTEPTDEFKKEGAVKCPDCGNPDLVLGTDEDREVLCPSCTDGKLIASLDIQT